MLKTITVRKIALLLLLSLLFSLLVTSCNRHDPEPQEEEPITEEPKEPSPDDKPKEQDEEDNTQTVVHTHTFSNAWSFNEESHWHIATCEHTAETSELAAHDYDENDICKICGFDSTPEEPAVEVSITYQPDNGNEPSTVTLMSNTTPNPPENPAKEGFLFLGWFEEDAEEAFQFTNPIGRENVTLTARWETLIYVSVTYNPENGEATFTADYTSKEIPEVPAEPKKIGYTLLGWFEEEAESAFDFTKAVGTEDVTLTARWGEAYTYTEDENGITLTSFVGHETEILLPHELYGKNVVSFGTVFSGKPITSIDIAEGYTEVENSAFAGCTVLKTVILPATMTKLGASAFSGCETIRKFVIPKAVSIIGSQCFAGCTIILIYANVSGKQNGWAYDWNPLDRQVNYDVSGNLLPIHYF